MSRRKRYYHASASDLPAGTILSADGKVFMSTDLLDSHDWGHLLGNLHLYEVTPTPSFTVTRKHQKDALSGYEYITEEATIIRKIGVLDDRWDDYCDGCLQEI